MRVRHRGRFTGLRIMGKKKKGGTKKKKSRLRNKGGASSRDGSSAVSRPVGVTARVSGQGAV